MGKSCGQTVGLTIPASASALLTIATWFGYLPPALVDKRLLPSSSA